MKTFHQENTAWLDLDLLKHAEPHLQATTKKTNHVPSLLHTASLGVPPVQSYTAPDHSISCQNRGGAWGRPLVFAAIHAEVTLCYQWNLPLRNSRPTGILQSFFKNASKVLSGDDGSTRILQNANLEAVQLNSRGLWDNLKSAPHISSDLLSSVSFSDHKLLQSFFAEITSAVSTWKKPSAKGLGFYFKLILKPCSSHRGYLKLTLAITLKQPTGTLKIQRNMVSICSVHGAYYSLMLSNHTSFCTWKVLHYHFIASVQKDDIHLCKPTLFEPPTVVEDKLWSIAVNVYKRGVHEAPWYKQHSYLVTGKAVSTPWPSLPRMDKNIDAFLSASLGGLFKISSCFKPLSEIVFPTSVIYSYTNSCKEGHGNLCSLNLNSCTTVSQFPLLGRLRTSRQPSSHKSEADPHSTQRAD